MEAKAFCNPRGEEVCRLYDGVLRKSTNHFMGCGVVRAVREKAK